MTATQHLLEAGALVPIGASVNDDSDVSTVSVRAYEHAALGERWVARLTLDLLAEADDLEMEFLGFGAAEVTGPVAIRRRQALGFPGWALQHDPANARYALEVVKEFKKYSRQATSKPGHAQDGFMRIAAQLGGSVPHFLPSFWEETGRVFAALGNASYATRAFTKARDAEHVHALVVDEAMRQEAFVEFALMGALAIKSLNAYAKELHRTREPESAFVFFRDLCIRRCRGGMPPWAGMVQELKKLIVAAGLDIESESRRFLAEILDSPAIGKAPPAFWSSYDKTLKAMAHESEATAACLIDLVPTDPESYYYGDEPSFVWTWVDYLERWGLLAAFTGDDTGQEILPSGGVAAWYARLLAAGRKLPQRAYDLLRDLAPRIRAEGKPLEIHTSRGYNRSLDLDLLDLALELEIPLAEGAQHQDFSLPDWASPSQDAVDRPRDPTYTANDERFTAKLYAAVEEAFGVAAFEAAAQGKAAFHDMREACLSNWIDALTKGGLPDFEDALNELTLRTSSETFAEFPECWSALCQADVLPSLARTVHSGLIDEYGWPELEAVVERLAPQSPDQLQFHGAAPYVVVNDGARAVAVGPGGVTLEHDLRIPRGHQSCGAVYIDGQIAVRLEIRSRFEKVFYWSTDPATLRATQLWYSAELPQGALQTLATGDVVVGGKIARAGDDVLPDEGTPFFSDAEHCWISDWDMAADCRVLRQLNPATGQMGRPSLPSFLENFAQEGARLNINACHLLAWTEFDTDIGGSPWGAVAGAIGWRARSPISNDTDNYAHECEGIDGRKFSGTLGDKPDPVPIGLLDLAGSDARCPLSGSVGWQRRYSPELTVWNPTGSFRTAVLTGQIGPYNRGQACALGLFHWHMLKVRDEATSRQLRRLDEDRIGIALTTVCDALVCSDPGDPLADATHGAVEILLPGIAHPRLHKGIGGVIEHAARLRGALHSLLDAHDPQSMRSGIDDTVLQGLEQIICALPTRQYWYGAENNYEKHFAAVTRFFSGELGADATVPPTDRIWFDALMPPELTAWMLLWGGEDQHWLAALDWWANRPFLRLEGRWRRIAGKFEDALPSSITAYSSKVRWVFHVDGASRYLFVKGSSYDASWQAIEFATDGVFRCPENFTIGIEHEARLVWSAEQVASFVALARARGRPPISRDVVDFVAVQTGLSYAESALLWMGAAFTHAYETNFLPKGIREAFGLKVAQAEAGRIALRVLDEATCTTALHAMLDGDPVEFWDDPQAMANRFASAWSQDAPPRLDVDSRVLRQLDRVFAWNVDRAVVLQALAAPAVHPWFVNDPKWSFVRVENSWMSFAIEPDIQTETLDGHELNAMVLAALVLSTHLAVGDPGRNAIVTVADAIAERLESKRLLFELNEVSVYDEQRKASDLLEPVFGRAEKDPVTELLSVDDGLVAAMADRRRLLVAFRPGAIESADDLVRLAQTTQALEGHGGRRGTALIACHLLFHGHIRAIRDRIENTPLASGQWEQNPLLSCPDLVQRVRDRLALDPDAAALYLQFLALPDPTATNVKTWNNWKPAQLARAAGTLVEAELLIEAKRARAGRKHFLPGAWEALKAPNLPLESWKLRLFDAKFEPGVGLMSPFPLLVPLQPLHDLFAVAWQRIEEDDIPRYEDVPS